MNQVDDFLSRIEPEKAALVHFLRQRILQKHINLTERMAYGLPFIYGKKGICYFNVKPDGIDVGFMYGNRLPGNDKLIATNRKQVRSLFFKTEENIDLSDFDNVFKDALLLDQGWK